MTEIEPLLERICADSQSNDIALLIELIAAVRPEDVERIDQATNNLLAISYLLEHRPDLRNGLRQYIGNAMATRKQSHLYAETGILTNQGFATAISQRVGWKILPPAINDHYLKDIFTLLFPRSDDHIWVSGIDDTTWLRFVDALHLEDINDESDTPSKVMYEILEAMMVLSHRLSAMGLEPELVRNYPDIERFESPFLAQSREISEYVRQLREYLSGERETHEDEKQGVVLLEQCRDVLSKVRRNASKSGVSVSLTYLLVRIQQTITRLETLFALTQKDSPEKRLVTINFLRELVAADNRKYSIRELFSINTELLALQITENAGRTGEHYVATTRSGYFGMLRSAMGAGLIVAFMSMIKALFGKLKLAPFGEAFLFSMNYSLGFMLIHLLHFTIATKQPAMTAANIAATISQVGGQRKGALKTSSLNELADLTVSVFRTQFIAIMGNIMIAFPVAYLLAWIFFFGSGHHFADAEKTAKLLHELDPFSSLAIFHAAIAGVCLFLAGLISGYYDNKGLYNRIPERLRQLNWLNKLFGVERTNRYTGYIENNLGALAGNFYFGIMLGSMGTLGFILGLPLDIRHITFSSANFALALAGYEESISWQVVVISVIGILGIGITNLMVSFSLALMVALKSRRVRYRQWLPLAGIIIERLLKSPTRFFFPPKKEAMVVGDEQTQEKSPH